MKNYSLKFLATLVMLNLLLGCGNSQKNSDKTSNIDITSNQTLTKKEAFYSIFNVYFV